MKTKYEPFDLIYAFDNAAEFLDMHEFAGDDGQQAEANKEAAKRIRAMRERYAKKHAQMNQHPHTEPNRRE